MSPVSNKSESSELPTTNIDLKVVSDFGREWKTFNQQSLSTGELGAVLDEYFHIFPFELIDKNSSGFDMGCGSGRWAKLIAPKVKALRCVDPSSNALAQAQTNLRGLNNCVFECASIETTTIGEDSQDFGYCLGVLHHVPDTARGLRSCVSKLRKGAPFLLYLYYRFDTRPLWFKIIWKITDAIRHVISRLPFFAKFCLSQTFAALLYFPIARLAKYCEKLGITVTNIPLSYYRDKSFYFMRTDALDRFGTRLEKRFTRAEILEMMTAAGLYDVKFSEKPPFWVAVGIKS